MEWKKKAIEYEAAYNEAKQQLEERERFLMKRHQAEIEALTKAQVDQTNENLDLLLKLENENKQLKLQLQNNPTKEEYQLPIPPVAPFVSNTSQLCNTAEVANQTATASVIKSRKQSNELVERINVSLFLNFIKNEANTMPKGNDERDGRHFTWYKR